MICVNAQFPAGILGKRRQGSAVHAFILNAVLAGTSCGAAFVVRTARGAVRAGWEKASFSSCATLLFYRHSFNYLISA
jgi:hypothetical protein